MRVLEARFHPRKRGGEKVIVVGRVYCENGRAGVKAAQAGSSARSAMQEKLEFLVRTIGRPVFERLRELKSDYWSFVEIDEKRGGDPGRH
jgi:hypothetical protein